LSSEIKKRLWLPAAPSSVLKKTSESPVDPRCTQVAKVKVWLLPETVGAR
jgi:hypothetical protein